MSRRGAKEVGVEVRILKVAELASESVIAANEEWQAIQIQVLLMQVEIHMDQALQFQ